MRTGFYYGGYGFMLLPSVGIVETYGGQTAEYHNAFAFYQLSAQQINACTKVAVANTGSSLEFSKLLFSARVDFNVSVASYNKLRKL